MLRLVAFVFCWSWTATSLAAEPVPFSLGSRVEKSPSGYRQGGRDLIQETLESTLGYQVPAAQDAMREALSLRTASRWCLGLSIPLLVGGVVNTVVASSGTVGDRSGTMAVYGVATGLSLGAVGLAVASLVLSNKSTDHYQAAVDAYNSTVSPASPAVSMQLLQLPSGFGATVSLRL